MKINISHECPLVMLKSSLEFNDYQYILPYFYERYPEYREFMDDYQGMKILDNGLFEGEIPTIQELLSIIKTSNPTIFIPPDEWNDPMITLKNAKYWMGLKDGDVIPKKLNLMVVLQGNTFSEIELLYHQCVDLGYRHFAFNHSSKSYQNEIQSLPEGLTRSKVGRVELIRRLWNKGIIKENHYIHLLGASDVSEFTYYNQGLPGVISSIDTSNPVIKGIEMEEYTPYNYVKKSKNKMEMYFDKDLDSLQEFRILENIKAFKKIINNK